MPVSRSDSDLSPTFTRNATARQARHTHAKRARQSSGSSGSTSNSAAHAASSEGPSPLQRNAGAPAAIAVASRDEIEAKIGRSPDFGTAYILALLETPRRADMIATLVRRGTVRDYDPLENL